MVSGGRMGDGIKWMRATHARIEALFEQIRAAGIPCDPALRKALCGQVLAELTKHCQVEERDLYPLVLSVLPDGPATVENCLRSQAEMQQAMRGLRLGEPDDERFTHELAILIRLGRHHLSVVDHLLERLARNCTAEQLADHLERPGPKPQAGD
jgi:hypothetical protein